MRRPADMNVHYRIACISIQKAHLRLYWAHPGSFLTGGSNHLSQTDQANSKTNQNNDHLRRHQNPMDAMMVPDRLTEIRDAKEWVAYPNTETPRQAAPVPTDQNAVRALNAATFPWRRSAK